MSGDLWGPCIVCGEYWEDPGIPECMGHCPKHMPECLAMRAVKTAFEEMLG